ncbi:stage V sporulation protein B [Desulfitobacterium dichloroeliminans LMG P-21439]|uniref:Stage V sporulation protein B n=1 Tax=Desulfitobacterium dichloroeliminans (strain LMG P-21439 / DCA1) TaxID=871963 RepID=L0F908_DESDL|nr:stage V sporulation protein B [Desulfitobacterium dichloroeliminans]AGA69495.1 stage V sporulation protein B [Desulfitobacterium dichloroeliminans LMG P-21439]
MTKRTFVYGAVILLTANFLNRVLGFIYQYLIMTHIGGEAFGLFNMVFPMYMLALVFTTAGIPLAVSKMISEAVSLNNTARAQSIFRTALVFLTSSGAVISLVLFFISPYLAERLFPDPRVLRLFLICTPAIFVVSISSAFRGYFQGMQNMLPTAISQICEQLVRVSVGFMTAYTLLPRGIEWAASGLALGMLAGEIVGSCVIILQYKLQKNKKPSHANESEHPLQTMKELFHLAYPVTIGRLFSTGLSSLDAMLIPQRLQVAGYTAREATTLFGQLGGAAFTLLNFPSVFTFALATSLVPAISEAAARKQMQIVKLRSAQAIRLTIFIGVPSLIILFFFADPFSAFFKSKNTSNVLRLLALGGIFSYLQQTSTGILQGLGKVQLPVLNSIIGAGVRIPILFTLTASPLWGLKGTALAYVCGFFVSSTLNLAAIVRYTGMPVDLREFILQPLIGGIGMMLTFRLLHPFFTFHPLAFFPEIILGTGIYFVILFLNGGINRDDLRRIPWLGKFIPR